MSTHHTDRLPVSHLRLWSRLFVLIALIAIIIPSALSTTALAQNGAESAAIPDRGVNKTGAYSVSDIENINLTNGNVNLSIPLASLPPIAGGKLSWTIRAEYSSKVWDVKSDQSDPDSYHTQPYTTQYLQRSFEGGWRISQPYSLELHTSDEETATLGCVGALECLYASFRYKYILTTPDGAKHEMRPLDATVYSGPYGWRIGYYSQLPTAGSPMRYYSFDGSYLWATVTPAGPTVWTVYLKDGTRVTMDNAGVQRIYDTNGNNIRIEATVDGAGVSTTHYIDAQTGREIKSSYDPAANLHQIQYQKVGGTWVTVTVNLGSTTITGLKYSINDHVCTQVAFGAPALPVVRSIVLPQTESGLPSQQFTFSYNSDTTDAVNFQYRASCGSGLTTVTSAAHGWGALSRMILPTGAQVDYAYTLDGDPEATLGQGEAKEITRERITQKKLTHDSGTIDIWSYLILFTSATVTGPDGSVTTETFFSHDPAEGGGFAGSNGKGGLVFRSDRAGKVRVERQWSLKIFDGANSASPNGLVNFNPVVDAEYTTLMESGVAVKMSAKTFQYDFNGQVTQETAYDWFDPALVSRDANGVPISVPGSAVVLRTTTNTYYNPATISSSDKVYAKRLLASATPLILSAPRDTIVGTSQTQFCYDNQAFDVTPTTKGNLTKIRQWHDQGSQWLETAHSYDTTYGNRLTTTDPRGNVTTFVYSATTHAQPTQVTVDPNNGTGTQTVTTAYDDATGLVTSQTDPNGQITTTDYTNQRLGAIDPFGRPGIVTGPAVTSVVVGGGTYPNQRRKVKMTYFDSLRQVVSETDLNQEGDYKLKSRTTSDQLGRVIKTERNEDGTANYTISAQSVYAYVLNTGTVIRRSNPKRSTAAATDGWTRATRNLLGRVIEVATFAGATQPPNTGTNSNWTGSVTTSYNANQTTVTDQIGKMRRSVADGLGRLAQVIEDPNGLNYQTNYTYDTLSNLRRVSQGTQNRYFMYDSLSRLIRAKNPEQAVNTNLNLADPITGNSQWSMKYTYDASSNLATRVDARNITTTYAYDGLNRNTSVSYNDGVTPTVERFYDGGIANGKGRLWYDVTYNVLNGQAAYSRTVVNEYDALGRVTWQSPGLLSSGVWKDYTVQRSYDLASDVSVQTYPSGRVANYTYDAAGRLSQFSGTLGDGGSRTYASNFSYGPGGQMLKERFGTTTLLYHNLHYNSRGQMVDNRLGTSSTDEWTWNRGALIFYYSNTARSAGNQFLEASDNNGNVTLAQHYVPDNDSITSWALPQHDVYDYDGLNRLQSVNGYQLTSSTGSTQLFSQKFLYDQYGNRTIDPTSWGPINLKQFTVDTATNRLGVPGGQTGTMSYDVAGNLTTDSYTGAGARTYDGENRMITAAGTNGSNRYVYDGNGRRVRRVVGATETWQVYGIGGELIAEYPVNGTATLPQKEYGYRNKQLLLVGGCDVARWLVTDQLGTSRIEVEVGGGLAQVKRHDYLPFGEEMFAVGSVRTTGRGYPSLPGQDCVRQQFTDKERDNETGLDYFIARYYSSIQGRFTSVDPSSKSIDMTSPQTWNRYIYAWNNPLSYVDHNGQWPTGTHNKILQIAFPGLSVERMGVIQRGCLSVDATRTGVIPVTLLESNAPKHGMIPGTWVKQHGLEKARQMAEDAAQKFIGETLKDAKDLEDKSNKASKKHKYQLTSDAIETFGRAAHTIMDSVSPAHAPFQVYDGMGIYLKKSNNPLAAVIDFAEDMVVHATIEEREPTQEEMQKMVDELRAKFREVFGEEIYNRAISPPQKRGGS